MRYNSTAVQYTNRAFLWMKSFLQRKSICLWFRLIANLLFILDLREAIALTDVPFGKKKREKEKRERGRCIRSCIHISLWEKIQNIKKSTHNGEGGSDATFAAQSISIRSRRLWERGRRSPNVLFSREVINYAGTWVKPCIYTIHSLYDISYIHMIGETFFAQRGFTVVLPQAGWTKLPARRVPPFR